MVSFRFSRYTFPKSPETWCRKNGFVDEEPYKECLGFAPQILDLSCKKTLTISSDYESSASGEYEEEMTTTSAIYSNVTVADATTTTE